jgi:hypothetical protein
LAEQETQAKKEAAPEKRAYNQGEEERHGRHGLTLWGRQVSTGKVNVQEHAGDLQGLVKNPGDVIPADQDLALAA